MKGKNIISKMLNIVMNIFIVIFGVVLLISIYNVVQVKLLGNDRSSFFGYSLFEVTSGSMYPEIDKGDWIIIKYSDDIEIGDIITFKDGENYITHRVVAKYNEVYTTRGDANNTNDDSITSEQIVGEVVKILPSFGIYRATIFNPFVLIALIITLYLVNLVFKKDSNVNTKKIDKVIRKIINKLSDFINSILKKNGYNACSKSTDDNFKVVQLNEDTEPDKSKEIKTEAYDFFSDAAPLNSKEIIKNQDTEKINDDFDKTIHFRMVKVDKKELKPVSIVEDEIDEDTNKPLIEELEEIDESSIEKNLEILYDKRKKFKNIIDKTMFLKEEELEEIINVLNEENSLKTNEATIKESLIDVYIDGKYYNYCGDVNVEYDKRTVNTRLCKVIDDYAEELKKSYKGNDNKYEEKVDKYNNFLQIITYLEFYSLGKQPLDDKKKNYKNKILKYLSKSAISAETIDEMVNKILKIQNKYKSMLKYVISKMDTSMFNLKYNQLSNKNLYAVSLEHNINFSNVYSDYIIDKTYCDGIIAEDKLEVLLNLLLIQLVKNMIEGEFNKKYIIYINEGLYDKVNKLIKIFKIFEDEYAKNNIIILIRYEKLFEHKKNIVKLINVGYKFAVDLQENNISVIKESVVQMMDYIFVNETIDKSDISYISKDIESKLLVANIGDEVGGYWGE